MRLAVLEALKERKDPVTEDLAIKALKESGWPHRQAAARLLGEIGTVKSIGPLVQAMVLEEGRLVEVMAESLRKLITRGGGRHHETAWERRLGRHHETVAVDPRRIRVAGQGGKFPCRSLALLARGSRSAKACGARHYS